MTHTTPTEAELAALDNEDFLKVCHDHPDPSQWKDNAAAFRFACHRLGRIQGLIITDIAKARIKTIER